MSPTELLLIQVELLTVVVCNTVTESVYPSSAYRFLFRRG